MNELSEGIPDCLKTMFDHFVQFCDDHKAGYDIVCDESDQQGYVLKDRSLTSRLSEFLHPLADKHGVHVDVDEKRKDGVLFTFTLSSIEEGHWEKLSQEREREEFSSYSNPDDAKRVRQGKTLAHMGKGHKLKLERRLDEVLGLEDQYKWATRKRKRDFSARPSSFGKSVTFGGIRESVGSGSVAAAAAATSGNSIPMFKEPPKDYGVNQAVRTNSQGEPKNIKPTKVSQQDKRQDLTDAPRTWPKNVGFLNVMRAAFAKAFGTLTERTMPSSSIGRPRDDSKRGLPQRKPTPSPQTGRRKSPRGPVEEPEPEVDLSSPLEVSERKRVKRDDVAAREKEDPFATFGREVNLRPLGEFGGGDSRQPAGGPVSNVIAPQPADRAPGEPMPDIAVRGKKEGGNPEEGETIGADPLQKDEGEDITMTQGPEGERSVKGLRKSLAIALAHKLSKGRRLGEDEDDGDEGDEPDPPEMPEGDDVIEATGPDGKPRVLRGFLKAVEQAVKDCIAKTGHPPCTIQMRRAPPPGTKLPSLFSESLARPEDGYEFMQRLVEELGMTSPARKQNESGRIFVMIRDGSFLLELEHRSDGAVHSDKLMVYNDKRLLKELDVDLGKNTVVTDIADEVRGLID